MERTLLGVSSQVARNFVSKAEEIVIAVGNGSANLTRVLDERGGDLITAIGAKTSELSGHLSRIAEEAARSIDAKNGGLVEALASRGHAIVEEITQQSMRSAEAIETRLTNLQQAAAAAIDQSKETAAKAVSEMMETHGMLRSDTTALFERLREANGLLQRRARRRAEQPHLDRADPVGAGERVRLHHEQSARAHRRPRPRAWTSTSARSTASPSKVLGDLGDLAQQFDAPWPHALRGGGAAREQHTSARAAPSTERRDALEGLVTTLDTRTDDLDQRLKRFSALLDESLAGGRGRARDIARTSPRA